MCAELYINGVPEVIGFPELKGLGRNLGTEGDLTGTLSVNKFHCINPEYT